MIGCRPDIGLVRLFMAGLVACVVAACATPVDPDWRPPPKRVMTPAELRVAVAERVPELEPAAVPVLFEVDEQSIALMQGHLLPADLEVEKVRHIVRMVTSDDGLGLQYDRTSLGTASQTLERGTGNCLSLAAVLVGVARGLGWSAVFTEMSLRDDELLYEADLAIAEEHMGAKIKLGAATLYIDYSGRMSVRSRVRAVSDLRATAQYYSNYAYELLHKSHAAGHDIPWPEIMRRFEIATRIEPELAPAWNNLGVARSRLGDVSGAEAAYERAIALTGHYDSANRNLRLLHGLPPEPADAGRPGVPSGWEPVADGP